MNTTIKFAFAVGEAGNFESCHFGDAEKYLIFEWNGDEMTFKKEVVNAHKSLDETPEHGSKKKGLAIVELLQSEEVKVLISKQFGRNLRVVNKYFIPVVIAQETPQAALDILCKHMRWIKDELDNDPQEFKLFTINTGIFKTAVAKA